MPKYMIRVVRHETYSMEIEVEGETLVEALASAQDTLNAEGWDALCDDDGDYEECYSEAEPISDEETE